MLEPSTTTPAERRCDHRDVRRCPAESRLEGSRTLEADAPHGAIRSTSVSPKQSADRPGVSPGPSVTGALRIYLVYRNFLIEGELTLAFVMMAAPVP